ncbi:MAG: FHIPEP family type III secretion protein [Phycisphaerae bacterium]|nr:FHIPEP family type III secretion protein [Phycisphaerae bacterium]
MKAVAKYRGLIVPVGFVAMLGVIIVPVPPAVMDALICFNIALSVVVLMTTIYMAEPLEFSVFPSLLLATTLLRLVLNVASTRLILSADAASPEEAVGVAGQVIAAFGQFVAGDSLVVGIVIFGILLIVQFVVITKGATRISEVAARFTLDAMPGKQMAIDADLNAGLINEAEARQRRERISQEADFFGAMDGASKFVRGDAIAGLIIIMINVVGGMAIGILQRGWPAGQTAEVFTKLTIGDGITAALPSFVISLASALIVTRSSSKRELGEDLTGQLSARPVGLGITAAFMASLILTPLPTVPLAVIALALGGAAWYTARRARSAGGGGAGAGAAGAPLKAEPPAPETLLKLDTVELEVGYGLVGLVDTHQGGTLLDRISAIRRQLAVEMGFILPPIRIRDNLQLPATDYRVKVKGSAVARGQTVPGKMLAIDSGIATGPLEGVPTREPAFNLSAWWIDPALKSRAETQNYTVVDPTSVLATHLTEVVRQHAADLLTRQEVNELVSQLKAKAPKLVEDSIGKDVKIADLHRILQALLRERVSIRDLETIVETLADWSSKTKDLDVLTEYVRNALRRSICEQYATPGDDAARAGLGLAGAEGGVPGRARPRIVCVTLDPTMEDLIGSYIDRSGSATSVTMPPAVAQMVSGRIAAALQQVSAAGHQPVVLASPQVRAVVRQLIETAVPAAAVLGYNEIVPGVDVESLALVTPEAAGAAAA